MIRPTVSLLLLFLLAACGGAPRADAGDGRSATVPPAAETPSLPATPPTDDDAIASEAIAGEVDYGCEVDADCEVKNVGNCCGYYPACVNRASETFPEQVQARCRAEGEMSICGFPEIDRCRCNAGRCEAASSGGGELR